MLPLLRTCTAVIILFSFSAVHSQTSGISLIDLIAQLNNNQSASTTQLPLAGNEESTTTASTRTSSFPLTECGYRRGNPAEYGGSEAAFNEFPWMVSIHHIESVLQMTIPLYYCGGALIRPDVVLTAAHCLEKYPQESLLIKAGVYRQNDTQKASVQRQVKSLHRHPSFNSKNGYNDIALIVLDNPFELQENIATICLPTAETVAVPDARCLVTGWGKKEYRNSTYAQILKKNELPLLENSKCQENLRETYLGPYYRLHSSFICAGGEEGKDACSGDGGSPLVCPMAEAADRYYLAGLVSFGIACNVKDVPGVYANVIALREWINKTLSEAS